MRQRKFAPKTFSSAPVDEPMKTSRCNNASERSVNHFASNVFFRFWSTSREKLGIYILLFYFIFLLTFSTSVFRLFLLVISNKVCLYFPNSHAPSLASPLKKLGY
jgi:hypothetical protein